MNLKWTVEKNGNDTFTKSIRLNVHGFFCAIVCVIMHEKRLFYIGKWLQMYFLRDFTAEGWKIVGNIFHLVLSCRILETFDYSFNNSCEHENKSKCVCHTQIAWDLLGLRSSLMDDFISSSFISYFYSSRYIYGK